MAERTKMSTFNIHDQANEIKNLWQIIEVNPNSIIEMRAIKGREIACQFFEGSNYTSPDVMKQAFEAAESLAKEVSDYLEEGGKQ